MLAEKSNQELLKELEELRQQLREADDTIHAIRTGQVDALVVKNEKGHQLYTLKSADQTYRVFIEKMKEGAVTLNQDGMILYSNSQFASMMNVPLSGTIGLPISDFVADDHKEELKALIKKGWKSDSKGEICFKKTDDEEIPVLVSIGSLEMDEGTALSLIITDLTQQKETEKQLRLKNIELEEVKENVSRINEVLENIVNVRTKDLLISREYFKFLADNIPVIVWTTRADGLPDYFNKIWYDYTGLDFSQSSGTGFQQVAHPDDYEMSIRSWETSLKEKLPYQLQHRIRRAADGQYRWHVSKAEPFKDDYGNVTAWFGTSIDIHDQKMELEKKDEFISTASHELKTPLTSLKGYIQLMDHFKDNLPVNVGLYVEKAHESIIKLQKLIDDLLDVSKIQSGKLDFAKARINLSELLHEWVNNSIHIYRGYKFSMEIENELFVYGNSDRLEQVLMNLINNAVKYSPGNNEVIIRAYRENGSVCVSVTDFGIGLSSENSKKIFDRFFRVNDAKYMSGGLGMGLFISSEIIHSHEGTMEVKSKLNEGSTFTFRLPIFNSQQ